MSKSKKIIYLEKALRFMAVLILYKYNPKIIGITGSVGKTSAKEAIFMVLNQRFRVRKNEKNYNNEIGLPLTIIGSGSGGRSVWKWAGVFLKWIGTLIFPVEYPEVLALEMGADRPGDIKYLTKFIKCEGAVITEASGSHLEFFKTLDKVAEEKWNLVESLDKDGFAAINIDNPKIAKLKNQSKKEGINFLTYGFSDEADLKAAEVFYNYSEENENGKKEIKGLSFKLNYKGTTIPVRLNNVLAQHSIYAALAAIAVGVGFKLNLVEIAASLENFVMPSGRMGLVNGVKSSMIIDDTYNSSPISAAAALLAMKNIKASRKIAVLGDMFELGTETEAGHRVLAKKFIEAGGNIFFAVGQRMKFAVAELEKHNFNRENIYEFDNPDEAKKTLQKIVREGDLILVKGSQGMRMEKVVEEIMNEPEKSKELLCRQDASWKSIPWRKN